MKLKKRRRKPNPNSTDNLDFAFSRLIRGRDLWTCRACGAHDPEGSVKRGSSKMDCSHLVGRATFSTRWHPLAAVCHCVPCHRHLGDHPLEFSAWIKMAVDTTAVERLEEMAKILVKWTPTARVNLKADMRRELVRLGDAEAGRGEFFGFELPTVDLVVERGRARLAAERAER